MLELNNYVTAGKFFLVIAGELIAIFIVSLFLKLLGFQVTAVYVDHVNRIFAETLDFKSESWLVNASWAGSPA